MLKSTKQKYSQHDLRRLMQEQKNKVTAGQNEVAVAKKRIDSPLAKYNEQGQLMCVLCQSVVRSEDVWKVHLNAKLHKENVAKAKELKEKAERQAAGGTKRPAPVSNEVAVPEKKPKGILKNATPQVVSLSVSTSMQPPPTPMEVTEDKQTDKPNEEEPAPDATLPEGFFDDPKKDAIARNLEYKDPVQEEWERFQKEIKDAATESNEIIAEDQEESTAERQIVEIDEQIRNWDRVLALEKKKEERLKHLERLKQQRSMTTPAKSKTDEDEDKSESEEEADADDLGDAFGSWRAKGWKK